MYKGAVKEAYNFEHYRTQRAYDIKIKKRSMYGLLDNPEKLHDQIAKKVQQDNERYEKTCKELNKIFNLKE